MIHNGVFTVSDAIILFAVCVGTLKVVADYRGWTRSPALVRQENADLRERNATLTAELGQITQQLREAENSIAALTARVEELQKRDQAAVLHAIAAHEQSVGAIAAETRVAMRDHEVNATRRFEEAGRRHEEALVLWREIRDIIARGGTP